MGSHRNMEGKHEFLLLFGQPMTSQIGDDLDDRKVNTEIQLFQALLRNKFILLQLASLTRLWG